MQQLIRYNSLPDSSRPLRNHKIIVKYLIAFVQFLYS